MDAEEEAEINNKVFELTKRMKTLKTIEEAEPSKKIGGIFDEMVQNVQKDKNRKKT